MEIKSRLNLCLLYAYANLNPKYAFKDSYSEILHYLKTTSFSMKISYLKTLHCSKKKHHLQQLFYYFTGILEFLGSGHKSWMLGSGCWKLNRGLWALDAGPWTLKL